MSHGAVGFHFNSQVRPFHLHLPTGKRGYQMGKKRRNMTTIQIAPLMSVDNFKSFYNYPVIFVML